MILGYFPGRRDAINRVSTPGDEDIRPARTVATNSMMSLVPLDQFTPFNNADARSRDAINRVSTSGGEDCRDVRVETMCTSYLHPQTTNQRQRQPCRDAACHVSTYTDHQPTAATPRRDAINRVSTQAGEMSLPHKKIRREQNALGGLSCVRGHSPSRYVRLRGRPFTS